MARIKTGVILLIVCAGAAVAFGVAAALNWNTTKSTISGMVAVVLTAALSRTRILN